ncbi:M24 family metallopeptidase [Pararhizobium gei]|uniref:M24 family metallopeptidase n=1 Tax=Pararhizobium gei TaxID=1395951 RepID=UPI0023DA3D4D|nr:Xaa-Pro peptidase family protein [Rhizobium gei]
MTQSASQYQSSNFKLPFPPEEFSRRRAQTCDAIRALDIDAIVLTTPANYYYVSGLPLKISLGLFGLVLCADGRGFWIGRRTYMKSVSSFIEVANWSEMARSIADEEDAHQVFGETINRLLGPGVRLGFELDMCTISPNAVNAISRHVHGCEIRNASGIIERLRSVKSPLEVQRLREAGAMAAAAMREVVSHIDTDQTDSTLASLAYSSLMTLGSDQLAMPPIVVSGPLSATQSTAGRTRISAGDLITLEFSAAVDRYCAPIYRIGSIGPPNSEGAYLHAASRAGLLAALQNIGPGMTSHSADQVVRAAIAVEGCLEYFTVRAGYSVGIGFPPSWDEDHIMKLSPGNDQKLEPGMVFHLVPALYQAGVGAACCSNTIHITENGAEALVPIESKMLIA